MAPGADLLAGFALWWVSWALYYAVWSSRRPRRRVHELVDYELFLVVALGAGGAGLLAYRGADVAVDRTWPVWVALGVGALVGLFAWLCVATRSALVRLGRLRPTKRLVLSCGLGTWNAVGEEVAFRFLFLCGLALLIDHTVVALLVSAIVFGLHHYPVAGWKVVLVHTGTGLVFGGLAVIGGGLVAAVVAHAAYNVAAACMKEVEMTFDGGPMLSVSVRR